MVNGVDPVDVAHSSVFQQKRAEPNQEVHGRGLDETKGSDAPAKAEVASQELVSATVAVQDIVKAVSETNLSFSVEQDLNRMVVAVRSVGSDKIIRQFPPEEFLTVAKFLASQDLDMVDEDFLKGVLFDQYS